MEVMTAEVEAVVATEVEVSGTAEVIINRNTCLRNRSYSSNSSSRHCSSCRNRSSHSHIASRNRSLSSNIIIIKSRNRRRRNSIFVRSRNHSSSAPSTTATSTANATQGNARFSQSRHVAAVRTALMLSFFIFLPPSGLVYRGVHLNPRE